MPKELDPLAKLHATLITQLLAKVESGAATAAELSVARQMLKDNNITASAPPNSPLANLATALPFTGDSDGDEHYAH